MQEAKTRDAARVPGMSLVEYVKRWRRFEASFLWPLIC